MKHVTMVCLLVAVMAGGAWASTARGTAAETANPAQAPGQNQIIVVLTCTPNQGAGIRVNPFRRHLAGDATATWRSVGNFRGAYTIEPDGPFPWSLSNGGTSDGDGEVTGTPPANGTPDGVYSYRVRFTCNGEEVVLDPRMEVP